MAGLSSRVPRQPKLRSSCDGCGTAKLKCDRGQPECERCLSLGQLCIYGVSRKMGKPPRDRIRIPDVSSISRTRGERTSSIDTSENDDNGYISGTGGSGDSIFRSAGQFLVANNSSSIRGTVDDYTNGLMMGIDLRDTFQTDILWPSLNDFTSLEFGDDIPFTNLETRSLSTLASPQLDGYSASAATNNKACQPLANEGLHFDNNFIPLADINDHDCSREAYDILGTLSFLNLNKADSTPGSTTTLPNNTSNHVPLDRILRLNRECGERLSRLLNCSCARCPNLVLLYASIISQILIWYQQAAGCTQNSSGSFGHASTETSLQHVSSSESLCGPSSSWSSTPVNKVNTDGTSTPALAVAPTQMAMGSFSIDDQQMQTALRIQLLLGEIRRVGHLIDMFTSHGTSSADEFAFNSVDGLYKSLSSWLRRDQLRITEIIKSKLKEINI